MKDIREMLNISYFDNKELSLKEHCDIYSNIKKDLISILNKYDIKYVIADTESIRDLSKENKTLKKQIEELNRFKFSYRKDETKIPPVIRKQNDIEIIKNLEKENQELKKQLEEYKTRYNNMFECHCNRVETEKLKNQQKEFIDYLEEEMKLWTRALNEEHDYELVQEFTFICNIYEEILSKYKEIIGGKKCQK